MRSVAKADFRLSLAAHIAVARHEPVLITTDSADRQAVLVSPEFFERALQALGASSVDRDSPEPGRFRDPIFLSMISLENWAFSSAHVCLQN